MKPSKIPAEVNRNKTVRVVINATTYPKDVRAEMKKIESGAFDPADIDLFQDLQWIYARKLVSRPAIESVDINDDPVYNWPDPPCRPRGQRRDHDDKSVPEAK